MNLIDDYIALEALYVMQQLFHLQYHEPYSNRDVIHVKYIMHVS